MAAHDSQAVSDWSQKATECLDAALKTTAKMQEETMQWWATMMGGCESMKDLQDRTRATAPDAITAAQKTAEAYVQAMNHSCQIGLAFLSKAFESGQIHTMEGVQGRMQTFCEHVLGALRANSQAFIRANSKAMESWAQLVRTNGSSKIG